MKIIKNICSAILIIYSISYASIGLSENPMDIKYVRESISIEDIVENVNDIDELFKKIGLGNSMLFIYTTWCHRCTKILSIVADYGHLSKRDMYLVSLDNDKMMLKPFLKEYKELNVKIYYINPNNNNYNSILKSAHNISILFRGEIPFIATLDKRGKILKTGGGVPSVLAVVAWLVKMGY